MALAGFRAGEAEGLRRAMSRKRSEEALNAYRERFVSGAIANGVSEEVANRVYERIKGFSGFGFPKSHAAAFGLLAYQSTWLRVHYGPEFLCGVLNEQPMGFYPPDALVHEAQRRGIGVLGPDVNASEVLCHCEWQQPEETADGEAQLGVRIGLGYVAGLAEADAEAVAGARREGGSYRDLGDLAARSGASRDGLEKLAWADACTSIGADQLRGETAQRPVDTRCLPRGPSTWKARPRRRCERATATADRSAGIAAARPAERLGAGHRRLQRLRHVARRAPDGPDAP